jgi:hypothetical protein
MGARWQHGTKRHPPGLHRNTGILRVFSSKEEAKAQAALVWRSVQANCPDREAPPNWRELLDEYDNVIGNYDSDEGEERQKAAVKGSSSKAQGRASTSSKHASKKRKPAAAAADPDSFRTVTADGRACWKRKQHFYIDPWTDELKNVSASTLTVEVLEAQLVA